MSGAATRGQGTAPSPWVCDLPWTGVVGSCSPSEFSPRANLIKVLLDMVGYLDVVVSAWWGQCPPPWSPPLPAHIPLPKFHFSILLPSPPRGGRNETHGHLSPGRG